jgi:hypothetical protein
MQYTWRSTTVDFGTGRMWAIFTPLPHYLWGKVPLDRSLGGPQNWSGRRAEEKSLLPMMGIGLRRPTLAAHRYTDSAISACNYVRASWKINMYSIGKAVDIATGYGLKDRGIGVRVPVEPRIFYFSISSRPVLGPTQPPIQWVRGIKCPVRKAHHSHPDSAEVKKMWIYTSLPILLHGVVLN